MGDDLSEIILNFNNITTGQSDFIRLQRFSTEEQC